MPELILGPLQRYVSETEATIWVETDAACEVEVLDARASTFHVEGHHYALVQIEGLEPDSTTEYGVSLDGERRWPPERYPLRDEPDRDEELPAPRIRTLGGEGPIEIAFGSCRVALPHQPPYTMQKDHDERGREFDALYVLAREMLGREPEHWPSLLLMLGDQVYVDEGSPRTREFIRSRRDVSRPPGEAVADFEEYTRLYWESWSDPLIRWLLSTVSSSMIWDDHDMHDDWNISRSWVEDIRREPWWSERVAGGVMSYWLYQHIGNLSPHELADDELFQRVSEAGDAGPILRKFAAEADRGSAGRRWSYYRDLGRSRLIVMDSRGGRVLSEDRRSIFDDDEWDWVQSHARGDFDHLLIGTSDPFLLTPGMHYLEAWNERVCDGAWGRAMAWVGERVRRALDFDHWAAFAMSFARLTRLVRELGSGERGKPPASIVVLSGDVHHAYLADVAFRRREGIESAVWQAVVSPMRNSLDAHEIHGIESTLAAPGAAVARGLARAAGADDPDLRWRLVEGPFYDNQIGTLRIDGRDASMKLEKCDPADEREERRLETVFERTLTRAAQP